jgi:hypothetical protein
MKAVFTPFKNQFERDDEKYKSIIERNSNNGKKGGRPLTQINPNNPVGILETQQNPTKPKKADNDNDNKNDSVNDNESVSDSVNDSENIAIAFLKNLPDDEKKILKDKLNIKHPFMYQKSNGTQVSFARYLHEAFFDPINSPRIKNRFTKENHYWRTIAEFTDVQIVSENYKRYQSAGEIRKHFINWHTQKQKSND